MNGTFVGRISRTRCGIYLPHVLVSNVPDLLTGDVLTNLNLRLRRFLRSQLRLRRRFQGHPVRRLRIIRIVGQGATRSVRNDPVRPVRLSLFVHRGRGNVSNVRRHSRVLMFHFLRRDNFPGFVRRFIGLLYGVPLFSPRVVWQVLGQRIANTSDLGRLTRPLVTLVVRWIVSS